LYIFFCNLTTPTGAATISYIITTLQQNNVFMAIATVPHHNLYNFTAVISSLSLSLLASLSPTHRSLWQIFAMSTSYSPQQTIHHHAIALVSQGLNSA